MKVPVAGSRSSSGPVSMGEEDEAAAAAAAAATAAAAADAVFRLHTASL